MSEATRRHAAVVAGVLVVALLAAVAVAASVGRPAEAQPTPGTLTGEQMGTVRGGDLTATFEVSEVNCDPNGESSFK